MDGCLARGNKGLRVPCGTAAGRMRGWGENYARGRVGRRTWTDWESRQIGKERWRVRPGVKQGDGGGEVLQPIPVVPPTGMVGILFHSGLRDPVRQPAPVCPWQKTVLSVSD